jgi:hypothetical protein
VGEKLGTLSEDAPQLLTEEELRQRLGNAPPGTVSRLVRKGSLQTQGEGGNRRFLVNSPALLDVGRKLLEAGIDIETAITLHEILERRLAKTARELVQFAIKKVGQGFGRSAEPEDIMAAIETLFQQGVGAEAVRLTFNKEIERAVQEALQMDANILRRKSRR